MKAISSFEFLGVVLGLSIGNANGQYPPPGPKPKGLRISWVGHSFHVYLPSPVSRLAGEAGIRGHQTLGVDFLPASMPCQHWTKGGGENGTNAVKNILKAARADVQTLSTQQPNPDPCVPKFARLAYKYKKNMRLMVQETWLPNSALPEERCQLFGCSARNAASNAGLEKTRQTIEIPFENRMRWQADSLNREFGMNFTTLVPTWSAVLTLRQLIAKGQLPGVARQQQLFIDNLGHPTTPMVHMTAYMWFAALYQINPTGSRVFGGNRAQEAILQKVAWETLSKEPLSGLGTVPGQAKGYKALPAGSTPPPAGALPAGFPGYSSKGKGTPKSPKGSPKAAAKGSAKGSSKGPPKGSPKGSSKATPKSSPKGSPKGPLTAVGKGGKDNTSDVKAPPTQAASAAAAPASV